MLRSRILTGLVGALFVGVVASQMASCTLDQAGTLPPPEKGGPCNDDTNCQDRLPCAPGICLPEKNCEYQPQADGPAPAAVQIASDCLQIVCKAGVDSVEPDLADFTNDNNSCTTDACVGGIATNTALKDGAMCDVGDKKGVCLVGKCDVSCKNNAECEDGNPCSENFCDTNLGKCVFTNLDGVLTPNAMQVAGDCKVRFCENGVDSDVNDDADVSDDGNPCTDEVCTAGVPSNPNFPAKRICEQGKSDVCDGNGACVECVDKDDCVNIVETECEKRSCVANKCVIAYEGQTTLASPVLQNAKDCKKVVCNGPNGTTAVPDNADLPDDNNPCTTDTCSNGNPVSTDKAQGTACGNNQVCNAIGDCIGCNAPTDCMGTDDFCKKRTCVNETCGTAFTPNGTDLDMGQMAGDCKVLECDGMGNVKTSVLQSDVPNDNNACTADTCNAQGNFVFTPVAANSPCSVGVNDACDGNGVCKKSLGKTCGNGPECVSTRCVDGVCCNSSCTTTCESCNIAGSIGMCTPVPVGSDDNGCMGTNQSCNGSNNCDFELGQSCGGNGSCLSNMCVDGVCCSSSCNGPCRACSMSKTGMASGTCNPIPMNADPDNECATQMASTCGTTGVCDGNNACAKHPMGTVCVAQSCMVSTQTNADTCDGNGTCNDNGTSDCAPYTCGATGCKTACATDTDCSTGNYCSGTTCMPKKVNGAGCTVATASQCASGLCVDNVCCNSMCDTECKSCDVVNFSGTCTNVPLNMEDTMCMGTSACNGTGTCKLKNGQACTMIDGSQCLSGNCVDGFCCDTTCNADCKSCGMTGMQGMCSNVPLGTNDGMCNGNNTCNAAGVCKLAANQICMVGADCASGDCSGMPLKCQGP
jgi:hypothetical protein